MNQFQYLWGKKRWRNLMGVGIACSILSWIVPASASVIAYGIAMACVGAAINESNHFEKSEGK